MAEAAPSRRSTLRVLRVLTYLSGRAQPVPATVIAESCSIPKQTLYPMLADMSELGFVSYFPEERAWGLGVAAFEVGSAYLRAEPLQRLGRPVLDRLSRQLDVTSHLAVLHGNEALYLVKHVPRGHSAQLITDVGVRLPAHLTAVGRAVLAYLPRNQLRALYPTAQSFVIRTDRGIATLSQLHRALRVDRERGFSLESDLTTEGVTCVAASVHDHACRPVAAVGVSFATESRLPETWGSVATRVCQAADALTSRIHGQRVSTQASPHA